MPPFDPDAYLKQSEVFDPDAYLQQDQPFDPDAYLGAPIVEAVPSPLSTPEEQPPEVRGQRTEDSDQRSEGRGQPSALSAWWNKDRSASPEMLAAQTLMHQRAAAAQEDLKPGSSSYNLGTDLVNAAKEAPKGIVRGGEQTLGAVGPVVESVGDYIGNVRRSFRNLWYGNPVLGIEGLPSAGDLLRRKSDKPVKAEIKAPKREFNDAVSEAGQQIYDHWIDAANTGWEKRDSKIYKGSFTENPSIARIVGGAADSAVPMVMAMGLSVAGAPGAGAALLAGTEAAPIYTEAKRKGLSEKDAFSWALISGIGTAALERVGLDALTGKIPVVNKLIEKLGSSYVAGALVNFAAEGSQEAIQEMYQNAVAIGYGEDISVFQNALEAGLSGGLMGSLAGGSRKFMSDYMQKQADAKKGLTDQQIDQAVRDAMRPESAQIKLVPKDGTDKQFLTVEQTDLPASRKPITLQVDVEEHNRQARAEQSAQNGEAVSPPPPAAPPATTEQQAKAFRAALPKIYQELEPDEISGTVIRVKAREFGISEEKAIELLTPSGEPTYYEVTTSGSGRVMGTNHVQIIKAYSPEAADRKAEAVARSNHGTIKSFKELKQNAPKPQASPQPQAASNQNIDITQQPDGSVTVEADIPKSQEQGMKPTEQKKWLVAEIDVAIKSAPEMMKISDEVRAAQRHVEEREKVYKAAVKRGYGTEEPALLLRGALAGRNKLLDSVTIKVPDDGEFTVFNTKEALREFEKRAKSFPTTKPKADYGSPASVKPSPMAALNARPESAAKLVKLLKPFVSSDETRQAIGKVFKGNEGELVATDGRRLSVVLGVDKTPAGIKSAEVNYKRVVPGYRTGDLPSFPSDYKEAQVDTERLYSKLNQVQHVFEKKKDAPIQLVVMRDGSTEIYAKGFEGEYKSIDGFENGIAVMRVNLTHLKDSLAFLRRMGNEKVALQYNPKALDPFALVGKQEYVIELPLVLNDAEEPPGFGSQPTSPRPSPNASASPGSAGSKSTGGGLGETIRPEDDVSFSQVPIEMPELVQITEQLGRGTLPRVMKKLRLLRGRAAGVFRYAPGDPESGRIELRADIFKLISAEEEVELRKQAAQYAQKLAEIEPDINVAEAAEARFEQTYNDLLAKRKKQDPVWARKVVAHEIGHWVDFLPEGNLSRGNLLGHIAALKRYSKTLLEETPGSGNLITPKDRAALRRRAERELRSEVQTIVEEIVREVPIYAELDITVDDVRGLMGLDGRTGTPELYEWFAKQSRAVKKEVLKAAMKGVVDERAQALGGRKQVGTKTVKETVTRTVGGKARPHEIRKRYRELLKEEVKRRRLHELNEIKEELKPLIAWWNGTPSMPNYYNDPAEMFADAFSVFINNPLALAKRAPLFYKALMDHIGSRPEWQKTFNQMQEDIRNGVIYKQRVDRLHKAFQESGNKMFDARETGRKKSARETKDWIRYSVDATFGPVETRVRQAGLKGEEKGRVLAAVENYLYRATGHEYYMGRLHQEVVRPLLDAGLQWSTLSEFMFHNRVINERHSMANPLGWTSKSSIERLAEMKQQLGAQKWSVLQEGFKNFWDLNGVVRDMLKQSGYVTPKLLDQIESNLYYATFAVNRDGSKADPGTIEEMLQNTYGSNVGAKIYKQLGTLQRVQDPAAATAMKMLSLMDAARRNVAKAEMVDLLREHFPDEIQLAQTRFRTDRGYNEVVVRDGDRVGTVVVMRDGKPEGWYVPRVFMEAFERGNPIEAQMLLKTMSPSRGIKNLYTQVNYGFWPVAFVRDVMAFLLKMPRVSGKPFGGPQFWRYFLPALKDSWSSVMGKPNAGALDSLSKQDWITVANPMAARGEGESIDKLLKRYWQDPTKINADAPVIGSIVKLWTRWLEMGQVLERTVKRAGRLYLENKHADMPEWQKQFEIHNYSGSPNFPRKGAASPQLDMVTLFFNPWKESIRSMLMRTWESPATMAWNVAKFSVAPKVLMWLFATGAMTAILKSLFGDDGEEFGRSVEEMYSYVPEYDKTNYTIIPFGWADHKARKVLYLRLPLAEEIRVPAGLAWKTLNKSGDKQQVLNYMGGQLPVGNPMWEVPLAWAQYASGKNPYDWFRGQPLLPDSVAEARDSRGTAAMGKYTWNALGGSIIHRFDIRDYGEKKTRMEKFLDLPVVSNALGRWLKISNRGVADQLRQDISEPLRRDQARSRLDAREALMSRDFKQMGELMSTDPRAAEYIKNNIKDVYMRQNLRPEDSMLLFAPTKEEREALMQAR